MSRKQLVNRRFKAIIVDTIESEEFEQRNVFKELIDKFKPERVIFPEYDEFKIELKKRLNAVMVDEEWKKIDGFDYSISNYGRIMNNRTKKIKIPENSCYGYQVYLYNSQKRRKATIGRLVAEYFIRPVMSNERVRHIDNDINNNFFKNLEIVKK